MIILYNVSSFEYLQGLEEFHFKKRFAKLQRKETIQFLLHALSSETTYAPRDDYKEVMELCLVILGHPPEKFSFKTPGPTHHARWMSKIIYSLKIYLFRDQFELNSVSSLFELSSEDFSNFEAMVLFASLIFIKAWIQCPLTSDAPVNDIIFFKNLQKYAVVSEIVSNIAITKFEKHLWYLGPELVILSLFSNNVPSNEKQRILGNATDFLLEKFNYFLSKNAL